MSIHIHPVSTFEYIFSPFESNLYQHLDSSFHLDLINVHIHPVSKFVPVCTVFSSMNGERRGEWTSSSKLENTKVLYIRLTFRGGRGQSKCAPATGVQTWWISWIFYAVSLVKPGGLVGYYSIIHSFLS